MCSDGSSISTCDTEEPPRQCLPRSAFHVLRSLRHSPPSPPPYRRAQLDCSVMRRRERWHIPGTLAATKWPQVTLRHARKYLCGQGVSCVGWCICRTENPRVGGSIPPLATIVIKARVSFFGQTGGPSSLWAICTSDRRSSARTCFIDPRFSSIPF